MEEYRDSESGRLFTLEELEIDEYDAEDDEPGDAVIISTNLTWREKWTQISMLCATVVPLTIMSTRMQCIDYKGPREFLPALYNMITKDGLKMFVRGMPFLIMATWLGVSSRNSLYVKYQ